MLFEYQSRLQGVRRSVTGLPSWARSVLLLFALPGIAAIALSIVALLCSVAALLLLTLPVYRLLRVLTGRNSGASRPAEDAGFGGGPRRHVDVKIIE